jgi:hypothetical protein
MSAHLQQVVHCKVPVPAEQLLEDDEVAVLTLQRECSAPPAGAAAAAAAGNSNSQPHRQHITASATQIWGAKAMPLSFMHNCRHTVNFLTPFLNSKPFPSMLNPQLY